MLCWTHSPIQSGGCGGHQIRYAQTFWQRCTFKCRNHRLEGQGKMLNLSRSDRNHSVFPGCNDCHCNKLKNSENSLPVGLSWFVLVGPCLSTQKKCTTSKTSHDLISKMRETRAHLRRHLYSDQGGSSLLCRQSCQPGASERGIERWWLMQLPFIFGHSQHSHLHQHHIQSKQSETS